MHNYKIEMILRFIVILIHNPPQKMFAYTTTNKFNCRDKDEFENGKYYLVQLPKQKELIVFLDGKAEHGCTFQILGEINTITNDYKSLGYYTTYYYNTGIELYKWDEYIPCIINEIIVNTTDITEVTQITEAIEVTAVSIQDIHLNV